MWEVAIIASLFWCRAEPVVTNGDDYLREASSIQSACIEAVEECERTYHQCEPKYCGTESSLYMKTPVIY